MRITLLCCLHASTAAPRNQPTPLRSLRGSSHKQPSAAGLAQLVEQRFCKPKVAGSSPASGTIHLEPAMRIFIDADACPVKDEVYKVAARYGLTTTVVSNSFIAIPRSSLIERMIVDAGPDVA